MIETKSQDFEAQRQRVKEALQVLRINDSDTRLQELADACQTSRANVHMWAYAEGMVIWHNRRAGTLIGTASAKTRDLNMMKAIYD